MLKRKRSLTSTMTNRMKYGLLGCGLATTILLVGCSSTDKEIAKVDDSIKLEYLKAYEEVANANTLDSSFSMVVDYKQDDEDVLKQFMDGVEVGAGVKYDKSEGLRESFTSVSANLGDEFVVLTIPMFTDDNSGKSYMPASAYVEMLKTIPKTLLGVDLTLPSELEAMVEDDSMIELLTDNDAIEVDKYYDLFVQNQRDYLDSIPAENFVKDEEDKITYTFDGNEAYSDLVKAVNSGEINQSDVPSMVDMRSLFGDELSIGEVKITSTIVDGTIESERMRVPLDINGTEADSQIVLHAENTYQVINEDIDFDMSVPDGNVITSKEVEDILGDAMGDTFGELFSITIQSDN